MKTSSTKLKKLTPKPTFKKKKANPKMSSAHPSNNSIVNYFKLLTNDGVQGAKGELVGGSNLIKNLTLTTGQGPGQDDQPKTTPGDPGGSSTS